MLTVLPLPVPASSRLDVLNVPELLGLLGWSLALALVIYLGGGWLRLLRPRQRNRPSTDTGRRRANDN